MSADPLGVVNMRFRIPTVNPSLRLMGVLLPIVFALHVSEEAPRFVEWFNSLVERGISDRLFYRVNATAFALTAALGVLLSITRDRSLALVTTAWVGFLMLANALFHIVATIAHMKYSPGTVTAALLYLPTVYFLLRSIVQEHKLGWPVLIGIAMLAGVPMYIHGYMIVFMGSRLF